VRNSTTKGENVRDLTRRQFERAHDTQRNIPSVSNKNLWGSQTYSFENIQNFRVLVMDWFLSAAADSRASLLLFDQASTFFWECGLDFRRCGLDWGRKGKRCEESGTRPPRWDWRWGDCSDSRWNKTTQFQRSRSARPAYKTHKMQSYFNQYNAVVMVDCGCKILLSGFRETVLTRTWLTLTPKSWGIKGFT